MTRLISLSDRGSGGGGLLAGHRANSAAAMSTAPDKATVEATGNEDFASEDVAFADGLRLGILLLKLNGWHRNPTLPSETNKNFLSAVGNSSLRTKVHVSFGNKLD